MMNIPADNN
jgi:hypothetical protein